MLLVWSWCKFMKRNLKFFTGNYINFSTDLPPSQIRGNHRSHFRTFRKYYKNFQEQGLVALHNALLKTDFKLPFEKAIIVNTFYNNRLLDLDNFGYGMKAIQDVLVLQNVLIDDDALSITPINRFRKCTKNERRVDVMVFDTTNYKSVSIVSGSDFLLTL